MVSPYLLTSASWYRTQPLSFQISHYLLKKNNTAGATGIPSGTNQARSHSATHSQSICYSFYKLLMTENTFQLQLKAHKIQSLGKPQTEGNRAFFANISCHISSEYIKKRLLFSVFSLHCSYYIIYECLFFFLLDL